MEKIPKLESKNNIDNSVKFIMENEEKFSSYREKLEFLKLFFMQKNNLNDDLDKHFNYLSEFLNIEKNELEELFIENNNDIISFVNVINDRFNKIKSDNQESNISDSNFGSISFDGKNIHTNFNKDFNIKMEDSFKLLAEHFTELDIVPSKIEAYSWLMGNKYIIDKIGFKKVNDDVFEVNTGISVWGQFIDKNENIKKKEVEYLFKNGEPRYRNTNANISFKDFMERYGSKFLGRKYTIEYDFSESQGKILEDIQRNIKDTLENKFNVNNWFDTFYSFLKESLIWKDIIGTDEAKLFFKKLHEIEKDVIDFDSVIKNMKIIASESGLDVLLKEKSIEFIHSKNFTNEVYI